MLRDVSFRIAPGERVAIVGATGSGKTTIIKLLDRLYDVQRGRILVDGVDVRDWDLQALRRRIAVVLQDVFLFTGTVADNITLGRPDIDRASGVEAAARHVNADGFIRAAGRLRRRGARARHNLSAGQRQLLAFARALAHDPAILVLDEATSSVDPETEWLIQDALEKLLARPHGARHRAPPLDHRARRPHPRAAQGRAARGGHARRAARARRHLRAALPAAVRAGAGAGAARCGAAR